MLRATCSTRPAPAGPTRPPRRRPSPASARGSSSGREIARQHHHPPFGRIEQALIDLDTQLRNSRTSLEVTELAESEGEAYEGCERDLSIQLTAGLQKLCQDTLSATKAKQTGQSFGEMQTDDHSMTMQGIVDMAQDRMKQSFSKLTTMKSSRAFQGQMSENSFAMMFRK